MSRPEDNANPPRQESDREDIMREATAMKRRLSFAVDGLPGPIVAGFRSNGFFAVFFDQNPVYQFDADGRLRRAYRDGLLYRTQGATLAQLTRVRLTTRTELQRVDLTEGELNRFVQEMREFLQRLQTALQSNSATLHEQIPPTPNLVPDVLDTLRTIQNQDSALAPALPTRQS